MNFTKKNLKLVITLFSVGLIFLLSIFGILEYKWFNKIAENEYYKTYNSIILNTNKISSREFERITLFTSWLNKYKGISSDYSLYKNKFTDTANLEEFTISVYNQYFGKDNENIISSIGYIKIEDNTSIEYLYNGETWENKAVSPEIRTLISESQEKQNTYFNNENLLITIFVDEHTYFIVNLNLKEFTSSILLPAIEEADSEISIEWISQSNDNILDQYSKKLLEKNFSYKFNPISSLIHGPYISNQSLIIPIIKQELFKPNIMGGQQFKNEDNDIAPINSPPKLIDSFQEIDPKDVYAYLAITINESEYFGTYIETTLSYIFLGGIILIGLIGIICILLTYQIIRVKRQRIKEKEFTASITHELRTPLTVIQSASDNLCENLVKPEKIPSYGKLIKQQSTRLNSMIENLLVFSKIEGNKFYNKIENKVNLLDFFEMMKLQTNAISVEKNTPLIWVYKNLKKDVIIDRRLLELVISNLISNSLFHAYNSYKGEIRIYIQFIEQNKTIHCTVEDDGIGIPAKEQKLIYNSYFRGENSKNSQERGSGLGLFIIKKNIAILGGKITLTSPYKRLDGKIKSGCHFEFSIPCKVVKHE